MKKYSRAIKTSICLCILAALIFVMVSILIPLVLSFKRHQSFSSNNIVIVEETSFLGGFKVIDDTVYIFCKYTIENFSDDVVYFELISNMPNDKKTDFLHKVNLLLMG